MRTVASAHGAGALTTELNTATLVNTFFNVEKEISHIAVDAPNVSACLNAVRTTSIALNTLL